MRSTSVSRPTGAADPAGRHEAAGDRYTRVAILLHWLIALLVIGQIAYGYYLGDVPRGTPARGIAVNLHKSMGIVTGLLILARLLWRLAHTPPALPASMPGWQRAMAHVSHIGLYLCMVGMPLSGYIASNYSKHGVKFFNTWVWAPWGTDDKAVYGFFNTVHTSLAVVFVALVVLHVVGALSHLRSREDGVLKRMMPGGSRG